MTFGLEKGKLLRMLSVLDNQYVRAGVIKVVCMLATHAPAQQSHRGLVGPIIINDCSNNISRRGSAEHSNARLSRRIGSCWSPSLFSLLFLMCTGTSCLLGTTYTYSQSPFGSLD